jgi:hypothetical protein
LIDAILYQLRRIVNLEDIKEIIVDSPRNGLFSIDFLDGQELMHIMAGRKSSLENIVSSLESRDTSRSPTTVRIGSLLFTERFDANDHFNVI